MAIKVIDVGPMPDVYTRFMDMHSGGGTKTDYKKIYIQAPEEEAITIFRREFGQDPGDVACNCCGPNFSVSECDSLAEATAYDRNVSIDEDGFERWLHANSPYIPWDDEVTPGTYGYRWGMTEYCLRPDVLVIQTREI